MSCVNLEVLTKDGRPNRGKAIGSPKSEEFSFRGAWGCITHYQCLVKLAKVNIFFLKHEYSQTLTFSYDKYTVILSCDAGGCISAFSMTKACYMYSYRACDETEGINLDNIETDETDGTEIGPKRFKAH